MPSRPATTTASTDSRAPALRVVVLGAGLAGVTSAWRLARDGHQVVVVDAAERVAQGASSTNAGMIAPGHAYPWASPAALPQLVRALLGDTSRLRVREPIRSELARWGAAFLRECTPRRTRRNLLRTLELCRYSEQLLHSWATEEGIDYRAERGGALYLHRSEAQLDAAWRHSRVFRAQGRQQLLLDPEDARRREPALADTPDNRIAGAIFDPEDSSGDAERFTVELSRRCEADGVEFLLGRRVVGLRAGGGRVTGVLLADGSALEGDVYVLALGAHSAAVARTIGERLAIRPVKGYTATFPVLASARAPRLPGVDEARLIAWSRQGDRLRLSRGADFAGFSRELSEAEVEPMLAFAARVFPEAADYDAGVFRAGLRPMTPDGLPVIRRAAHPNLIVNAGHGHLGFTLACGSAQTVTDLVRGEPSKIVPFPARISA